MLSGELASRGTTGARSSPVSNRRSSSTNQQEVGCDRPGCPRRVAPRQRVVPSNSTSVLRQSIFERPTLPPSSRTPSGTRQVEPFLGKCSDLGVPAPYGRNIAPMRVNHRRGHLIGESQERVARAIRLRRMPGDVGVCPQQQRTPFSWPGDRGPGRRLRKARGWPGEGGQVGRAARGFGIDRSGITP